MPLLAVGTTNPGKVAAVRTALSRYQHLLGHTPTPTKVSSGVSDQPMSMRETTAGAKNRAEAAAIAAGAKLGIGLESGLFESDGKLFDVTACAIFDGEQSHIGYSSAWELPPAVADKVQNERMNLTQAFNACNIANDPNIGNKDGVLGLLTGGRVTRPDYTAQAVQMALLTLNPEYYPCSSAVQHHINDPVKTAGSAARLALSPPASASPEPALADKRGPLVPRVARLTKRTPKKKSAQTKLLHMVQPQGAGTPVVAIKEPRDRTHEAYVVNHAKLGAYRDAHSPTRSQPATAGSSNGHDASRKIEHDANRIAADKAFALATARGEVHDAQAHFVVLEAALKHAAAEAAKVTEEAIAEEAALRKHIQEVKEDLREADEDEQEAADDVDELTEGIAIQEEAMADAEGQKSRAQSDAGSLASEATALEANLAEDQGSLAPLEEMRQKAAGELAAAAVVADAAMGEFNALDEKAQKAEAERKAAVATEVAASATVAAIKAELKTAGPMEAASLLKKIRAAKVQLAEAEATEAETEMVAAVVVTDSLALKRAADEAENARTMATVAEARIIMLIGVKQAGIDAGMQQAAALKEAAEGAASLAEAAGASTAEIRAVEDALVVQKAAAQARKDKMMSAEARLKKELQTSLRHVGDNATAEQLRQHARAEATLVKAQSAIAEAKASVAAADQNLALAVGVHTMARNVVRVHKAVGAVQEAIAKEAAEMHAAELRHIENLLVAHASGAELLFATPPAAYMTYDDDAAIGKQAPSIDSVEYVKDGPVVLGGGKVSVVTFFAKFAKGDYTTIVGATKLAEAFPTVNFVGISIDPEKGDAVGFLKKLGTSMPEIYINSLNVTYPLAWDNGKAVKEAYRKVAGMMSLGASACFVVDGSGTIVWREQFGQGHAPHQGQLGEQIRRTIAGEELLKNGSKPAEEEDEGDEEIGDYDDYDSDLGF